MREALGRTGTREDIYRIIGISRQSANRQSRERMDPPGRAAGQVEADDRGNAVDREFG